MNGTSATELAEVSMAEVGAMAIITLDPARYVAEVFAPRRAKLAALIAADEGVIVDVKTTAGMDMAIKRRAGYRDDVRIAGEKDRATRKAPMLAIGKLLDSEYKALAAEAAPHEEKWDALIKAEEARKEAEKAAKIAAERERVEAIQREIQAIRDIPASLLLKPSSEIAEAIDAMRAQEVTADRFAEFLPLAQAAIDEVDHALTQMHGAKSQAEQAARDAEAARLAEIERQRAEAARLAAEREELTRERAAQAEAARIAKVEADRVAAEQRAEAKRLADIAEQQRAKQAERERVAAARVAEQLAEIVAARKALADQQSAADARDAAARQAAEDAAHALARYDEAHADNAQFDAARLERDHSEALEMDEDFGWRKFAFELATPADLVADVIATTGGMYGVAGAVDDCIPTEMMAQIKANNELRAEINASRSDISESVISVTSLTMGVDDIVDCAFDPLDPTDEEIIDMGKECGLDAAQWVERLRLFVVAHG